MTAEYMYVSVAVNDTSTAIQKPLTCVDDINDWMSSNRLRLNPNKIQINVISISVMSENINVVKTARDLGVVIDSQMSLSAHISALCRSAYYQLPQARPAVLSLTVEAAKTLVQAFIACRLDYCNSLLQAVSDGLMRKVQSIQNAAARLITRRKCCGHITPVLCQLHWLPVRQRVTFKFACLVYQSLSGNAPMYLADDIHLLSESDRHQLRSSSTRTCIVPTQQLRQQKFCRNRTASVEQLAISLATF